MRILLTNDDGIGAPGLAVMARHLAAWARSAPPGEDRDVLVVAPHQNASGMSSAVGDVFEHPSVRYRRHRIDGAEEIPTYGLEAPPALCSILGSLGSFGVDPDVVVSGINAGANVGRSVLHSGTVGAILTGAQLGKSGLAVSVQWGDDVHYETAAAVAVEVLEHLVAAPARTLLNLNVPNLARGDLRGVRRGRVSAAGVVKAAGPSAGGEPLGEEGELPLRLGVATPSVGDTSDEGPDDDAALLAAGYASLTPLRGPHEDTDPALDSIVRGALEAI
ncbi:MAG TPA: 5'/3'-nucleotidase SurE, partial [Acidimicrobiales bacterium]|nr:5'/3'-nucleotidase SurE [Acidimicrobiales bacterium]